MCFGSSRRAGYSARPARPVIVQQAPPRRPMMGGGRMGGGRPMMGGGRMSGMGMGRRGPGMRRW